MLLDIRPLQKHKIINDSILIFRGLSVYGFFPSFAQLGNRIQHALRAFTPRDQKAVKAAAETFRVNEKIDVKKTITELGVGEALVSFLDEKGQPTPVERAFVLPPQSRLMPLQADERDALFRADPLYGHYKDPVDNRSAYEDLGELNRAAADAAAEKPGIIDGLLGGLFGSRKKKDGGLAYDISNQVSRTFSRKVTNKITNALVRGVFGALSKK